MKRILLLVAVLAALAACGPRPEGPAWERDDPARRVYGGGTV